MTMRAWGLLFVALWLVVLTTGCTSAADLEKAVHSLADSCDGKFSMELQVAPWGKTGVFKCDDVNKSNAFRTKPATVPLS